MSSDQENGQPPQNQYSDDGDEYPQRESVVSQGAEVHNQQAIKNELQDQSKFHVEAEHNNQDKQNAKVTEGNEEQPVPIETSQLEKSQKNVQSNQATHEETHEEIQNEQTKNEESVNGNGKANEKEQQLIGAQNKQNYDNEDEENKKQDNEVNENENKVKQNQVSVQQPTPVLQDNQANDPVSLGTSNQEPQVQTELQEENKIQVQESQQENEKQEKMEQAEAAVEEVQVADLKQESRALESSNRVLRKSLQSKYLINQPREQNIEEQVKNDKEQAQPLLSAPAESNTGAPPIALEIEQKNENQRQSASMRKSLVQSMTSQNKNNMEQSAGKDPKGCAECNMM